jgi:hypothetical protein
LPTKTAAEQPSWRRTTRRGGQETRRRGFEKTNLAAAKVYLDLIDAELARLT